MKGEEEILLEMLEIENFIIKFLADQNEKLIGARKADLPKNSIFEIKTFNDGVFSLGDEILNKINKLDKSRKVKK